MQVAFVLRSGGEYTPKHVDVLAKQLHEHLPRGVTYTVNCFTDLPAFSFGSCSAFMNIVPLVNKWPGWWSKLEMFRPDVKGGMLYFDLDTVINGSLRDIAKVKRLTLLRDFYRDGVRKSPEGLGSGMMYLPEADRAEVWEAFIKNPQQAMAECARGGDQQFLERFYLNKAQRWQDVVPNQVVSYKVHCKQGIPGDARVICMHGKPRPWNTPEFKHLYE